MAENSSKTRDRSKAIRFTALDLLIVALVIVCVVGVFFRGRISDLIVSVGASDKIEVGFTVRNVDDSLAEMIVEDDSFYISGKYFASVEALNVTKAYEISSEDGDNDGILDKLPSMNKSNVEGTLIVSGHYTENGFLTDSNEYLTVGKMLEINAPGYTLNVIITEIPRK